MNLIRIIKFYKFTLHIAIFLVLFLPNLSLADLCSKEGYTIATVNGIFTNEKGARDNMVALKNNFGLNWQSQDIKYDFFHNPSHIAGLGDLIKSAQQGLFDQKSDYDLQEMINDASQKVKTQKLLLVAHSQGNFYANSFYDKVVDKEGGVPRQSMGVYGVASPANRVSGNGKYLTSDTDKVIATLVARYINILTPNINIPLQGSIDGNGHSFSDVYLKYQGNRIVSDIRLALNNLKENDEQKSNAPCISPPDLSIAHKVKGLAFAVADPTAIGIKTGVVGTYNAGVYVRDIAGNAGAGIGNFLNKTGLAIKSAVTGLSANVSGSLPGPGSLATGLLNNVDEREDETTPETGASSPEIGGPLPTNVNPTIPARQIPARQGLAGIVPVAEDGAGDDAPGLSTSASQARRNRGGGGEGAQSPEQISPVISILGSNPITVNADSIYTDAGATAMDNIDSSVAVIVTGVVDTSIVGTYTITYTATDLSGNIATESRVVNVVALSPPPPAADVISPIISIIGNNPENIVEGNTYIDAGATAMDAVDGQVSVVSQGTVDTTEVDVYTITYTATDLAGNVATATRTVNVVPDDSNLSSSDLNSNGLEDRNEDEVIVNSNASLSAGEYRFNNLIITNNATLTLEGNPASENSFKGVKINAVNITIDPGSFISADKKGYGPDQGPGAEPSSTQSNSGASYGGLGYGTPTTGTTYGSALEPTHLGSGGASTNHGGGAIYIIVSGTLTNDGVVSAGGGESSSGGSIYAIAGTLSGSGIFRANGGGLYQLGYFKSPGGGGRIALYYQNSSFTGIVEAKGGCGSYDSWSRVCAADGTTGVFDETTKNLFLNGFWKFLQSDAPFAFNKIFILDGAMVTSEEDVEINADEVLVDNNSSFALAKGQTLNIPIINIDGGSTLTFSEEETINTNILNLKGNSTLTVILEKILSLEVANLNIESGSSILADQKGYGPGAGPGVSILDGAGSSHGGIGYGNNETSSSTYGLAAKPTDFGSGGAGLNRGGGAIRIIVSDTLTNDGVVSAGGGESASGGSIYVTTDILSGSGVFRTNGGALFQTGYFKGPGGGGRVALYYESSSFNGTIEAKGGCGNYGSGTVCAQDGTVGPELDTTPPE
ncbi:MAG: DUF5011 domain-containing protein [Candidatus Paceibacterota bacterium]